MENFNAITENHYSDNNQAHLEDHKESHDLSSNAWAGFQQWKSQGRQVKKGTKGCKIFIVCDKKIDSKKSKKASNDELKKKVLKGLFVFSLEHTEPVKKAS